ncbi:MAG TPA: hypothetical protein VK795_01925 [Terriglobales bacterium]|jgi:hypothetical protein|nr:hypothetical protein [Terriglobales bacterium]
MDRKNAGIEYDRDAFVHSEDQMSGGNPSARGILVLLASIAAIIALAFLGYKIVSQADSVGSGGDSRVLSQLDQRLATIEQRIEQLEQENHRRSYSAPSQSSKNDAPAAPNNSAAAAPPRYQVSPAPQSRGAAPPDAATQNKIAGLQQGLGALQNDTSANREAWQATSNKLADVSGQVSSQNVQILRNQDEVNQLLAHSEKTSIPFELLRGSEPQLVGPVHLALKSTNQKNYRYTLCVYVEQTCLELKDRNRFEVVEFILSRNSPPLEVIATRVTKDGILGYLEVPRDIAGR